MSTRAVTFRLPEETIECLRAQSNITGKSKTQLVIHAIHRAYELQSLTPPQNGHHPAIEPQRVLSELACSIQPSEQLSSVDRLDQQMSRLIDTLQQVAYSAKVLDKPVSCVVMETYQSHQGGNVSSDSLDCFYHLDQILAAIPNPVFLCDRQYRVSYLNPASARMWRLDRNAVLGCDYADIGLPPVLAEQYAQQFESVLTMGQPTTVEIRVPSIGCTRHYSHHFYPIEYQRDRIDGVIGIAHDITEHRHIENELRDSREKYRNLFEFANDMIFILDMSSRIIEVNQCAARRLGYVRQDLEQQTLDDISSQSASHHWHKTMVAELEKSGSAVFKHMFCRKSGEAIAVEISARLVEFSDQLAFQLLARDISY